ncbi:DUF2442 domain-containing protein [Thermosulfurimonas dismutans]|uniref:DUF2442 domain-containing protein n=1 Tax=Thermosulfurimonas dismutans TaxID=999894 RepID=A0A179D1Y7_9BACT|nr:DUF2442 domain-containing protein [Thermosulfurimonas dismutans]OAQ19811.1 hypothetical protein TDIS_2105 [Thermosulfurimonas dismutans]
MNFSEIPRAKKIEIKDDRLIVELVDGRILIVPLVWYPRLWHATPEERKQFELLADGEIIHWPLIDEDLSVEGLLAGRRSGESPESFSKWRKSRSGRETSDQKMEPDTLIGSG